MQRIVYCLLITCIVIACNSNPNTVEVSNDTATATSVDTTPKYGEMKTYWMVFLLKGPNRTQDSVTSARIQQAHMANIERLANDGKIIMAGPMGHNRDPRGIFIMNCKDSAEAAGYIKTDSAIISGRLRFEIHPW